MPTTPPSQILHQFGQFCQEQPDCDIGDFLSSSEKPIGQSSIALLLQFDVQRHLQQGKSIPWKTYFHQLPDCQEFVQQLKAHTESLESDSSNANTIPPSRNVDSDQATVPPNARSSNGATDQTTAPTASVGRTKAADSDLGDFAGYELICELARGGMGVVYRARDTKLNRMVALKMVLSGRLASEEERIRFNLEATAAAQLDHPAITPIYEVGEHDGQQYFAMKLIEGGALEDILDSLPSNPRQAAELVAKVAAGVHHAHQRGTLHRDLKPQNILLDADGNPLITDFGLAKLTDGDSNMTRTGVAMGTPAYMPPEQAVGEKNVTTAADIYSLGAILFATLTGRAPFEGGSAMETMLQVIEGNPIKPSSINPKVPLELELIAMKCLSHDPELRYGSAAEVEDDLSNWLAGKPVSVRPPSMASQATQWLKHNIRMAGLSLAVGCLIAFIAIPLCLVGFEQSGLPGAIYKELPQSEKPIFAGMKFGLPGGIPDTWKLILISTAITLVSSAGAISVALSKPKTMNESVGVGIISGIAVTVTLFLLFFGWMVGGNATANFVSDDVALLAAAVDDDEANRSRAFQKIRWRYPDVANRSNNEQILFLRNKISQDTVVLTGLGNILAALVSMMFFIPVIFAAAYFFRLSEKHESFLHRILGHFEFIFVGVMMSLALIWMVVNLSLNWLPAGILNAPSPGALNLLVCVLFSSVTLWSIWTFKPLATRLTLIAAALGIFVWFTSNVFVSESLDADVMVHIENNEYSKAAERFQLQTRQGGVWFGAECSSLVMAARAGDWKQYDQYRNQFIATSVRNEHSYYESTLPIYLESMLLSPIDSAQADQMKRIAEYVRQFSTPQTSGTHFNLVVALWQFRNNELDAALESLDKVPIEPPEHYTSVETQANTYLLDDQKTFALRALILYRQGKTKEASSQLKLARDSKEFLNKYWFQDHIRSGQADRHNWMVNAFLVLEILIMEAESASSIE